MSESQGGAGRREVAWRLFAAEFEDATLEHSESDEERAPNYVITPTGARVNRLFAVGVLTEVESVTDDVLRGRVVDPTGAFVTYAGQYQPEAMAFLDNTTPPQFVAVTGKARTFQPEDSDLIYTSIRPESINAVDADTRDRWTVQTAEQTLSRVRAFETALDSRKAGSELVEHLQREGVGESLARGISLALDHYGTTYDYLDAVREMARDALRVVAGKLEAGDLDGLAIAPDEGEGVDIDRSASEIETDETATETDETTEVTEEPEAATESEEPELAEPETSDAKPADATADAADAEPEAEPEPEPTTEPEPEEAEASESDSDADDLTAEELEADVGGEMYEMDEEERREVEEEYGTEFSTGATIGEPGEADIETPEPEPETEVEETGESEEPVPVEEPDEAEETEEAEEPEVEADEESDEPEGAETEAAEDKETEGDGEVPDDLNAVVMEYMHDLDDGDGADREALIGAVTDDYAVSEEEVEEAIQDALMGGQCYEAAEDALKPI